MSNLSTFRNVDTDQGLFTQIRNDLLQKSNLSYAALGLLCRMLSYTAGYELHISTLISKSNKNGRDLVYAKLNELKEKGYVKSIAHRDQNGRFYTEYLVYGSPQVATKNVENSIAPTDEENPHWVKNTSADFPDGSGFTDPVNPYDINIDIINNKIKKKQQQLNAKQTPEFRELAKNAADPYYFNVVLNPPDLLIADELTDAQKQCVKAKLAKDHPSLNTAELFEQVCYAILKPNYYTASGNDFMKKLNTISKCLGTIKWSPPAGLEDDKKKKLQKKEDEKFRNMNLLQAEIEHAKKMIKILDNPVDRRAWVNMMDTAEKKLAEIAHH